eukprot:Blabericola_migrator_1__4227@NODE_2298_length_2985_cov_69_373544_g685_i1_p3_GENE_NODE_2298_length_2985_cov_69_373544_g685_i1NODE_2298_length_2985_cov_69_373544_g685_i1_p3_ORF_typecomplete_len196_score35_35_NODE_2298_length_2985_cov_69_373544_g685_i123282915
MGYDKESWWLKQQSNLPEVIYRATCIEYIKSKPSFELELHRAKASLSVPKRIRVELKDSLESHDDWKPHGKALRKLDPEKSHLIFKPDHGDLAIVTDVSEKFYTSRFEDPHPALLLIKTNWNKIHLLVFESEKEKAESLLVREAVKRGLKVYLILINGQRNLGLPLLEAAIHYEANWTLDFMRAEQRRKQLYRGV